MPHCVSPKSIKPGIRSPRTKSVRQHLEFLAAAPSRCCNKAASLKQCGTEESDRTVPVATCSFQWRQEISLPSVRQTFLVGLFHSYIISSLSFDRPSIRFLTLVFWHDHTLPAAPASQWRIIAAAETIHHPKVTCRMLISSFIWCGLQASYKHTTECCLRPSDIRPVATCLYQFVT